MPAVLPSSTNRWRLGLREIFALFVCAAVGLTFSDGSISNALVTSAAAALVVGLLHESWALRRFATSTSENVDLWPVRVAAAWRLLLALAIIGCKVLLHLELAEDFSPYFFRWSLPIPVYGFYIAIVLGYVASGRKWATPMPASATRFAVMTGASFVLLSLTVANELEVHKLLHGALEGVERGQLQRWRRTWAYPNHGREHYRFFWTGCLAAGLVMASCLSFVSLFLPRAQQSARTSRWLLFGFIACQAGICAYIIWFNTVEFVRVSPELAGAGLASSWHEWLQAWLLYIPIACAGAYALAAAWAGSVRLVSLKRPPLHHSMFVLILLTLGGLGEIARQILTTIDAIAGPLAARNTPLDAARWSVEPFILLVCAMFLSGLRQAYRRWTWTGAYPPIEVRRVDSRRFLAALAGIVLLTVTGIPALAAFGFALWFGPWAG